MRAAATSGDRITVFDAAQTVDLDRLDHDLRPALAPAAELFRKIIEQVDTHFSLLRRSRTAAGLDNSINSGAWVDAAFALIETATPNWKPLRLIYEDGEWHCSLSRQPHVPVVLDDTVEASHEVLPLAVLRALIEVHRRSTASRATTSPIPQIHAMREQTICCDNFAQAAHSGFVNATMPVL